MKKKILLILCDKLNNTQNSFKTIEMICKIMGGFLGAVSDGGSKPQQ